MNEFPPDLVAAFDAELDKMYAPLEALLSQLALDARKQRLAREIGIDVRIFEVLTPDYVEFMIETDQACAVRNRWLRLIGKVEPRA